MKTLRQEQQLSRKSQTPRLSPELNEFLHLLAALEAQPAVIPATQPAIVR